MAAATKIERQRQSVLLGTAFYLVLGLSREDAAELALSDNLRHFRPYPVGG